MRRHGWIAGVFSFLVPGLGQLYAGRWRRALAFFVLDIVATVGFLLLFVHVRTRPLNIMVGIGGYFCWRVFVVANAVRLARRVSSGFQPRWFTRWYVTLPVLALDQFVGILQIAMFLRDHAMEAFRIPSRSMSDTLLPGDRFLVDKLTPWEPARGDVVVFRTAPDGPEVQWAKRIIGLPGERVEVRGTKAFVDGRELDEPYVRADGASRTSFGPVVVPPDHYFLLGDHRDFSRDSRRPEVGFVARDHLVGRAMTIFASTDLETGEFRWERVGRVIR